MVVEFAKTTKEEEKEGEAAAYRSQQEVYLIASEYDPLYLTSVPNHQIDLRLATLDSVSLVGSVVPVVAQGPAVGLRIATHDPGRVMVDHLNSIQIEVCLQDVSGVVDHIYEQGSV